MYVYDMRTNADIPAVEIHRDDLRPGDLIGTLHGIAVWEVKNVNRYDGWSSVFTTLIASNVPANVGTDHTLTIGSGDLPRCYRPLANL